MPGTQRRLGYSNTIQTEINYSESLQALQEEKANL